MTMFINTPASNCASPRSNVSLLAVVGRYYNVWRQRQALKALNADALNDIGVTYAQAQSEAKRPVWDAPTSWRH